jgi:hypothetical protein
MNWHNTDLGSLSPIEGFDAMQIFLEAYWKRGGKSSDDIAILLGTISRNNADDLPPIDIAQWDDWLSAVKKVKQEQKVKKLGPE